MRTNLLMDPRVVWLCVLAMMIGVERAALAQTSAPSQYSTNGAQTQNFGNYPPSSGTGADFYTSLTSTCTCPYVPFDCTGGEQPNIGGPGTHRGSGGGGGGGSCQSCGPANPGGCNGSGGSMGGSTGGSPPGSLNPSQNPTPQTPSVCSSGSYIDNASASYNHWGWDFRRSAVDGVGLCRIHRPKDQSLLANFGPGVFSSYDQTVTITADGTGALYADSFDPQHPMRRKYFRAAGSPNFSVMVPSVRQTLKSLVLLQSNMSPIVSSNMTQFNGAAYVRADAWDGSYLLFQLFDVGTSGSRTGRIVQSVTPSGTLTIAYKTWSPTDLAASPSRALQIDTVTDRYGKTLTFTYGTTQVGGMWVISSITGPGSSGTTTRTYGYTGNNLTSVTYPDSSTSTFGYTADNAAKCTALAINDLAADPGHQKKTAYVSFPNAGPGSGFFTTVPTNTIKMVTNGNNEVAYLSILTSSNSQLHYEGGGRMKNLQTLPSGQSPEGVKTGYVTSGWNFTQPGGPASCAFTGTVEPLATHGPVSLMSNESNIETVDSRGVKVRNILDSDGWVIRREYPVDLTLEAFCYNAAKRIIRERDRDGRVITRIYNSQNQITEERVGLVDNSTNVVQTNGYGVQLYDRCATNDVSTAEYAVRKWEYVTAGNPGAGLISAKIDELNNRTDYQYDSNGRLWKVLQPADTSGGSRATTVYTYDSMGNVASTTDPEGHLVTYTYDFFGRLTSTDYADGTSEKTEYGTSGNGKALVVKTVDRLNVVTTYDYDASQRLTTKVTAAAVRGSGGTETATPYGVAVTETIQYVHGTDMVWKRTVNGVTTEYFYDYKGRVLQEKSFPRVGTTLIAHTDYDTGRVYKTTDPYGRVTYLGYDNTDSRLIRMVQGAVPEWAPPAPTGSGTVNSVLIGLTRDSSANAKFAINDWVHSAAGEVTTATDPIATQTTLAYDSRRRKTTLKRAPGTSIEARTDIIYDLASNLIELRTPRYFDSTDTNGYQKAREQWTYTGRRLRATHVAAPGTSEAATESFTYDLGGHVATKTDFGSNVWTASESGCCDLVRINKDPLGNGTITEMNALRKVAHVLTVSNLATYTQTANTNDPQILGESTTRYDARGRKTYETTWLATRGVVDPTNPPIVGLDGVSLADGLTTQYLYDDNLTDGTGLDNSTGVSVPKLGTGGSGTFNVSLSAAIAKLADTQANGGAAVAFNSSSPGSASVTINAEDEIAFTINDAAGREVMSGKLNNYRGSGATALNTLATWQTVQFDGTANVASWGTVAVNKSIDALGYAVQSWVDGIGRTIQTLDQLAAVSTASYNASGQQLSGRDPNNVGSDMQVDAFGRTTQVTDTYGNVTKTVYDRENNIVQAIDAKNKTTVTSYDARKRKKTVTDQISAVTTFGYTALGQPASLTDAESQTTTYTYDGRGNKLTETYPDHVSGASVGAAGYGIVTFVYDAAGRVLRKQDQLGDTCTFNYNRANRLTARDYRTAANSPSGTIADSDTFTFDRVGRFLTAVSGRYANTVAYAFDPIGRNSSESLTISGQTYTVGSGYNARGQTTSISYPDSSVQTRSYHATGALNQLTLDGATVSTRTYDSGRRMTGETLGNGIVESRTYRADNLLSTISYSGGSIGNLSYSWDANQNKTGEAITGVMSNYGFASSGVTYDDADRLTAYQQTGGNSQSWSLTSVGDWTSTTINGTAQPRTHGPAHEMLTNAGQNVATDVKGNITTIPSNLRPTGASTAMGLTWDFNNQLKNGDTDNNGTADVAFQYDAFGRRVARTAASGNLVFVPRGEQTVADYPLSGTASSPTYRYVLGTYVDEPIVRKSSSATHYFHRNQQYSVCAVSDSAGTVAERYAYSPYGRLTICNASGSVLSSSAIGNRYTYTGREWDSNIQLYYFRARWLSAEAGRFLTRDPQSYSDGLSLYDNYFDMRSVDPSGNALGVSFFAIIGGEVKWNLCTGDIYLNFWWAVGGGATGGNGWGGGLIGDDARISRSIKGPKLFDCQECCCQTLPGNFSLGGFLESFGKDGLLKSLSVGMILTPTSCGAKIEIIGLLDLYGWACSNPTWAAIPWVGVVCSPRKLCEANNYFERFTGCHCELKGGVQFNGAIQLCWDNGIHIEEAAVGLGLFGEFSVSCGGNKGHNGGSSGTGGSNGTGGSSGGGGAAGGGGGASGSGGVSSASSLSSSGCSSCK